MNELIDLALDAATRAGVSYADVRVSERLTEALTVKNGALQAASTNLSSGFGVRVLVDGSWGFAASALLDPGEVERVAREAVAIARASGLGRGRPVTLDDSPPVVGTYRTPLTEDPFSVPLDEKLRILFEADAAMARVKGISVREGSIECARERKTFASSDGARVEQEIVEAGAGIEATATNATDAQVRSYPNSAGGQHVTGGFEAVRAMDLPAHGERVATEAVQLLDAPDCPSGEMTLIIDSSQVALQVHESCGHPIELDRVLGMEASFAGTSFLTLDKLDTLQYGSEIVNIDADATAPGGLGTFGYDDEGVPAQNVPIVSAGRFVGYLTSRETAPVIGRRSMGSARASGWNVIPLIRMTNVNLRPGDAGSLDDLIADTDDGLLISTNKSWSIDDRRLNFQFGTQVGWRIRHGKLAEMVRNPTYTGITPQFWGSCDAICGPQEWTLWGVPNCGKGEPMQTHRVGHGASPARFRKVRVGVGRW
ncbi:MAG TPA: TldD/PmbA family protein [candidate division Zixibacteria bacterium]|nr:TldD/PmbA family protein [candidate division Zixibacteria bacterium]